MFERPCPTIATARLLRRPEPVLRCIDETFGDEPEADFPATTACPTMAIAAVLRQSEEAARLAEALARLRLLGASP